MKTSINLPFRITRKYIIAFEKCTGDKPPKDKLRKIVRDELERVKTNLQDGIDIGGIKKSVVRVQLVSYNDRLYYKAKDGTLYDYFNHTNR